MSDPIVGIACHGFSSEAAISMKSAHTVLETLKNHYASVFLLEITPNQWTVRDTEGMSQTIPKGTFTFHQKGEKKTFDVIFNALHGSPGEDGKLAAALELVGIPHTSCDAYTAGLTFNKRDCIAIARRLGIPTAASINLDAGEPLDVDHFENCIGYPCFVKANRAGSSFGVFKVRSRKELEEAIPKAFEEDSQLLIEKALLGKEVSVGVLKKNGITTVLPITEIVSENAFFDYAAKYEGKAQEITPANLPLTWKESVEKLAKKLYDQLNLKGLTRSEFIFENEIPHLLEINTVPGLTKESIIPKQCQAANLSLSELFISMIEAALDRNT